MKYSLKNKEQRKRNTIFGERKKEGSEARENEKREGLDEISQIGEDLEESKWNKIKLEQRQKKHGSIYQHINFEKDNPHKSISPLAARIVQPKHGRHALSPNLKPLVPKAQGVLDRLNSNPAEQTRSKMALQSHINEFTYFQDNSQAQFKILLMKLYQIVVLNNERITAVEKVVQSLIRTGHLAMRQINSGLLRLDGWQKKVDLFFNTMRNVYQGLRISKLKQQNLQLYLKQVAACTPSRLHIKDQSIISSARSNAKMQHSQESRELMTLLDYQSEGSHQFSQRNTVDHAFAKIKNFNEQADDRNQQLERELIPRQTFRIEASRFQRLSPFQANQQIVQSKLVRESGTHLRQASQVKSMKDYSFDNNSVEYDRIRKVLQKEGNQGMHCWLDEMGYLRRGNGTYVFNSRGEVLSMPKTVFGRLCEEGYLRPFSMVGTT